LSRVVPSEQSGSAGFTIIEVLVALAVSAASLAAIGALVATSFKGVRALEQRVTLMQTARIVTTGLPKRSEFALGTLEGEIAGHNWRVDVMPFFTDLASQGSKNWSKDSWIPRTVTITVRAPSGGLIRVDTVRLVRRPEG
jgi:general secretion pathway protein I